MLTKRRLIQLAMVITIAYSTTLFVGCTAAPKAVAPKPNVASAETKMALFQKANDSWQTAKKMNAEILAPQNFSAGENAYIQAEKAYKAEKSLDDIRFALSASEDYFKKAIQAVKLAQVSFPHSIKARHDALVAQSATHAPELWTKAEFKFNDATGILEDGNVKEARKLGGEAEKLYRQAELAAIKVLYLAEAKSLIKQADQKDIQTNAPKTLASAKSLIAQAEKELNENRYDIDVARSLAMKAKYQVNHAIYLGTTIKVLKEKNHTWEDLMLVSENPLERIAEQTGHVATFETGYNRPTKAIISYIVTFQDSVAQMGQDIAWYKAEALFQKERTAELVATLDKQLKLKSDMAAKISAQAKAQDSVATLSRDIEWFKNERQIQKNRTAELVGMLDNQVKLKSDLASKIAAHAETQELFNQMEASFTRDEARVLREGDDTIIRLIGLDFPSNAATIEQKSFALLTKVRDAINTLKASSITVTGYTDSYGSDQDNLILSRQRAEAVKQYILANTKFQNANVEAVGYGESQPIANNETELGRAANRRVEVVIHP
ncbi:MAG: OmpA family protein [Candidatus Marinimicrobia bacterium]|nr:OmpA family protein [Candidatus Neomarinimicrobiota bacterium]